MADRKTPDVRNEIANVEPQLRAALRDVLARTGGKASVEIELPLLKDTPDGGTPPWTGNIYRYSW